MKKIKLDDIKKMWMDAPEKEFVVEYYCYKNNLEADKIGEDDKNEIYSKLYPITSFIRDYCENIFYSCDCEPDDELKEMFDQIFTEEFI